MSPLKEALRLVAAELGDAGHNWALIGGLAVSVRLEPRFTRDVDLAVAVVDDASAESLIGRFRGRGFQIHTILEQESTDRLATVRLLTPAGEDGPLVDFLFASCGIEPEVAAAAKPVEIAPGLVVPVAQLGHLLAMKVLARDDERRPQDLVDIRNILRVLSDEELGRAWEALALITDRGFNRDKNLVSELEILRGDPKSTGGGR